MLFKLKQYFTLVVGVLVITLYFGSFYKHHQKMIVIKESKTQPKKSETRPWFDYPRNSGILEKNIDGESLSHEVVKYNESIGGTCSRKAYLAGDHQKIYSYTLYGKDLQYWRGLAEILVSIETLFPGWFVRIHTDEPFSTYAVELSKNHSSLHICDIMNLPLPQTSLKDYPKMLWRYFPLGDSQVDIVNFRDTDSQVWGSSARKRCTDAVTEWLEKTDNSLHVMRDHPDHGVPILGGTFGVCIKPEKRKRWKELRDKIYKRAYKSTVKRELDQLLLAQYVWPVFRGDSIAHDSYTCGQFWGWGSVPFPTERQNESYIGAPFFLHQKYKLDKKCPRKCRPPNHQDWKYC